MTKFLNFLKGKKTYFLSACAVLVVGLHFFNLLDVDVTNTLLGLLGFGAFATVRSSIK
jgi:hypothetical protein